MPVCGQFDQEEGEGGPCSHHLHHLTLTQRTQVEERGNVRESEGEREGTYVREREWEGR